MSNFLQTSLKFHSYFLLLAASPSPSVTWRSETSVWPQTDRPRSHLIRISRTTSYEPLGANCTAAAAGEDCTYRDRLKGVHILLSSSQAGSGRKVKQEQEEISRNHVPRLFLGSVYFLILRKKLTHNICKPRLQL